jgi:hypothetical protein
MVTTFCYFAAPLPRCPAARLLLIHSGARISLLLGFSEGLLRLAFDLLCFSLDLLSSITRGTTYRASYPALYLLGCAFGAVLKAFRCHVLSISVSHASPPNWLSYKTRGEHRPWPPWRAVTAITARHATTASAGWGVLSA